jgi:hypothetical protein
VHEFLAYLLGIVSRLDEDHIGSCSSVNINRFSRTAYNKTNQYYLAAKPQLPMCQ